MVKPYIYGDRVWQAYNPLLRLLWRLDLISQRSMDGCVTRLNARSP